MSARERLPKSAIFAIWAVLVVAILTQRAWPIPHQRAVFFIFFASALPFVFLAFRDKRVDRVLGELSYPLYLVHVLVWSVLCSLHYTEPHLVAAMSIVAAALIYFAIERPVERYRNRRFATVSSAHINATRPAA